MFSGWPGRYFTYITRETRHVGDPLDELFSIVERAHS